MPAAYDTFDYPSYWDDRDYEHLSEFHAISEFLKQIKLIKNVVEIGAGFGRLVPSYSFRAKKIILSDPSSKLLSLARENFKNQKNIKYIQSKAENLKGKIPTNYADLVIIVRVLHHIKDPEVVFKEISRIVKSQGYLLLEYPNKNHFKARISEFLKGNFTYSLDIFKKDIRSKKNIKKGTLPFFNYHPDTVESLLKEYGFEIVEKRSVSNIRSKNLKKIFACGFLVEIEKILQKVFSIFNFGPSMFILARKRG